MTERFHVPDAPFASGVSVELGEEESHHLLRVMRARVGHELRVFGDGKEYEAVLKAVNGRRAAVLLGKEVIPPPAPAFEMTFVLPWLKGGRTETVIQKLTELGAAGFIVFAARREVARPEADKLDRLRRTAVEACKQCERADPPTVELAGGLAEGLSMREVPRERRLVLAERDPAGLLLSQALLRLKEGDSSAGESDSRGKVLVGSGPEGGFHPDELVRADDLAVRVSLGPRILRAETAPVAAAAVILAAGRDL